MDPLIYNMNDNRDGYISATTLRKYAKMVADHGMTLEDVRKALGWPAMKMVSPFDSEVTHAAIGL